MDVIPSDVLARADQSRITFHAAHLIETGDPDEPVGAWSGYGDLTIDGVVYKGLGATNLITPVAYAVKGEADAITVTISSLDPTFVPIVLAQDLRGRTAEVFRLWFDEHGTTLLHVQRLVLGSLDQVQVAETPGGEATVVFRVETEAQGSQRSGGRIASDQDQRRIDAEDTSMSRLALSPEREMYWGGLPPARAGKTLNGGTTGQSDHTQ